MTGRAMRFLGRVKSYNPDRGFGFIRPDDGSRDVFIHVTAVEQAGLKELAKGDRISFELVQDMQHKNKRMANAIRLG